MERGTLEKQINNWVEDMYQPLDEIRKEVMIEKLHDEESTEEENIYNWANARPPVIPDFITVEKLEQMPPPAPPAPLTLAPSEAPARAPSLARAPAPAPEPIKKATSKKLSEKELSASQTSPKTE
ncbi:uncharacterized protein M6D78_018552 isoform 2-T2 [Vipera latastei]